MKGADKRIYIRPEARIARLLPWRRGPDRPALAVAGRSDLLFAAAELIERDGGERAPAHRVRRGASRRPARRSPSCSSAWAGGAIRSPASTLDRPLIMGIVNVTPDSFSDGGRYLAADAAIDHALRLEAEGADILDIGGEVDAARRRAVDLEEELRRVMPVIEALARAARARLSIDTRKAEVMRRAAPAGAHSSTTSRP